MVGGVQSPGPLVPALDSSTMVMGMGPGVRLQGPHHAPALWPARSPPALVPQDLPQ